MSASELGTAANGAGERDLVGILQVAADGYAVRDARNLDVGKGLEQPRNIGCSGLAFDVGLVARITS